MAASFVLGSEASSTYPKGTPPVLPPPAAALAGHFEHPAGGLAQIGVKRETQKETSDDLLIWRSDDLLTFSKSADQQIINFFRDEIRFTRYEIRTTRYEIKMEVS